MKHSFILKGSRNDAIQAVYKAPDGYAVTIKRSTRSLEQNDRLHARLTELSKRRKWAGEYRSVECWKRLCTAAWLRARGESLEILPAIDGHGVDVVFRRTSELTVTECGELMDFIDAWDAMTEEEE